MIDVRQWSAANATPRRLLELALVGVAVVIGLGVVFAIVSVAREWSDVRRLTQTYAQLTGVEPSTASPLTAQREEMLKRITTNRLIAPPPLQLTGVLGDTAIFNGGMTAKAGQAAGDMTVKSVGANWAVVEKDGKEQKMYVFQPMPSGPPAGRRGGPGRMPTGFSSGATPGAPSPTPQPTPQLPPGVQIITVPGGGSGGQSAGAPAVTIRIESNAAPAPASAPATATAPGNSQ
jgi:hypothetical protein